MGRDEKVIRKTFPTASFTLTNSLIDWLKEESERLGLTKSRVVREILEDAKSNEEKHQQEVAA